MAKKYVPVFFDWTETTVDLDQAQKGNLIDAIVDYASERRSCEEILEALSAIERVAFRFMKGQVDRNDEISAARSKAGSSKREQPETKENKKEQNETKPAKEPTKRFVPPTVEEVASYCQERGNGISAQNFVDFYTAKGWKVGSQPMKDWKACVRTWEQRGGSNGERQGAGNRSAQSSRTDYSFLK